MSAHKCNADKFHQANTSLTLLLNLSSGLQHMKVQQSFTEQEQPRRGYVHVPAQETGRHGGMKVQEAGNGLVNLAFGFV